MTQMAFGARSCTILLVEDEPAVARVLALALADSGHRVEVAGTCADARASLNGRTPDVILLDLGLPDGDGLRLCSELRSRSDVPIIVVTARSGTDDVVAGLDAGADDYVRKPVVGSELSARVRALLRRIDRLRTGCAVEVGDVKIDLRHGLVSRAGIEVPLTPTERRFIRELAACDGAVSRVELLDRVWGYEDIGDTRLLDVHVRRLRTKLERYPSAPQLILTVRGFGYRLNRSVHARSGLLQAEPGKDQASVDGESLLLAPAVT